MSQGAGYLAEMTLTAPRTASLNALHTTSRRLAAAGAVTLLVACLAPLAAQATRAAPLPRPTLVVFFTIDQMIPDYFVR